jgi:hypothetical protein
MARAVKELNISSPSRDRTRSATKQVCALLRQLDKFRSCLAGGARQALSGAEFCCQSGSYIPAANHRAPSSSIRDENVLKR